MWLLPSGRLGSEQTHLWKHGQASDNMASTKGGARLLYGRILGADETDVLENGLEMDLVLNLRIAKARPCHS